MKQEKVPISELIEKLKKERDDLFDSAISSTDETELKEFIKIKNIDDELFESLVLIYSNFKIHNQELKKQNLVLFRNIISHNIDALTHLESYITELEDNKSLVPSNTVVTPVENNTKEISTVKSWQELLLMPKTLIVTTLCILTIIGVLFGIVKYDPKTTQVIVDIVKVNTKKD